eukprot:CAMPEP_0197858378 /NCGR_PEP_ID=MMETSP1438-20131217/32148_1 /TAXON_ID=1461541 /ORGANISM="Pterosperma sp., Strain CCMP1384" /LENGTH=461 /DNA_ID=CAMNT_0043474521 /DNA_START=73 /DNA_END=1458 /DNA_ORIENTATION=-
MVRLLYWVATLLSTCTLTVAARMPHDLRSPPEHPDYVKSLPGLQDMKDTMYAGLIPVDKAHNGTMFYWFAASRSSALGDETPIILWLNGGPGASSLTGMFAENGPYWLNANLTLTYNEYSWNKKAHVLYVDNPVGTGYSYCDATGYVNTEEQMASQLYILLTGFLELHPEYSNNPWIFAGESYAGKYIPSIAYYTLKRSDGGDGRVRLAGVAVGDGLLDPINQYHSIIGYWRNLGFISERQVAAAEETHAACKVAYDAQDWIKAYDLCNGVQLSIVKEAGNPFLYDVRTFADPFAVLTDTLATWLNSSDVRSAIHVGEHFWKSGDGTSAPNPVVDALLADVMKPVIQYIPYILSKVPVMFYDGQFDGWASNHLGTSDMLEALSWSGQDEWRASDRAIWYTGDGRTVGGYVREAGALSFYVIVEAGHLVPANQPMRAQELIYTFADKTRKYGNDQAVRIAIV